MTPTTTEVAAPAPVTTVLFRTPRRGSEKELEAFARETNAALRSIPGHLGVDVIAPPPGSRLYAILVRFADGESLRQWQSSEARAAVVTRLASLCEAEAHDVSMSGMEGWIAVPGLAPPPRWKSVVVSFLAAYPTIALLQALVMPHFDFLPSAARGVVLGLLMCVVLTYGLMPVLSRLLSPFLYPGKKPS